VDTRDGKLRSCGIEGQYWGHCAGFDGTLGFGRDGDRGGFLGFVGHGWGEDWEQFVVEVPTVVPTTASVRMRSVAAGWMHCLALTEDGEVHTWTGAEAGGPVLPEILQELREHRVRRIAAGRMHNAAITDRGELFTWWDHVNHSPQPGGDGVGYADDGDRTCRRPRRVAALDGKRIVSVGAGGGFTVAVTDTGMWRCPGMGDRPASADPRPAAFRPWRRSPAGSSIQALHSLTLLPLRVLCRPRLFLWGCNIRMPRARGQPGRDLTQGD
jgi:alpha-tubulin suppressor-like RCC1 family protein